MNLTREQKAGSVHAKQVEYNFDVFPQHKITLHQKFSGDLLGGCTWRGAALLARLMLFPPAMDYIQRKHFFSSKSRHVSSTAGFASCIELGSGAGLVALAAAASGRFSSKIIATEDDEPDILSLLEKNIRENFVQSESPIKQILSSSSSSSSCSVPSCVMSMALPWGKLKLTSSIQQTHVFGAHFDLILCSEVLYDPELVEPLLATILALCATTGPRNAETGEARHPTVLLTNDTRAGDAASVFLKKAARYFSIERWSVDGEDKEVTRGLMQEFCPDWLPLKSNEEGIFMLQRKADAHDYRSQISRFEK